MAWTTQMQNGLWKIEVHSHVDLIQY